MQALPLDERLELVLPFLARAGWIALAAHRRRSAHVRAAIVEAAGDRIKVAGDVLDYDEFFVADEALRLRREGVRQAHPHAAPRRPRCSPRCATSSPRADDFDPPALEELFSRLRRRSAASAWATIVHALARRGHRQAGRLRPVRYPRDPRPRAGAWRASTARSPASTPGLSPPPWPSHFIAEIVEADLALGQARDGPHALPARAERLPAPRPRQVDLPQLRARRRSTAAPATCASTTPTRRPRRTEYVESIQSDVRWLGFDWDDRLFYASDYFEQLYELGRAARSSTARRTSTTSRSTRSATTAAPGTSPAARARTGTARVEENLDLFRRMRAGEFPDGARVLRAKIDMASGNINLRDPVMYRILHAHAPPHRRRLVHLPDVRLGARPVGLDRAHHALDLHARVRGPPAALRLVRRRARHLPAAADRVRAPERDPHGAVEAQAPAAGATTASSPAGTTRACRPSPASAAAASRPRRCATSASGSASPSRSRWSRSRCSSTACARS